MPSFQGYHGFPAIDLRVGQRRDRARHPRRQQVLREGDLISIDCGAILDGWHGDAADHGRRSARSPDELAELLAGRPRTRCGRARRRAALGGRLTDISHAVESRRSAGRREYGIVEEYGGHGIGTEMHQDPHVLNYGRPGRGPQLVAGHGAGHRADDHAGRPAHPDARRRLDRGHPGRRPVAAHFEHTVALIDDGLWVLTALDGGAAPARRAGASQRAVSCPRHELARRVSGAR